MVRVLVFGAGSVGTVYAMILQKGGAEVTCVCRSNLEAAKTHGFTVKSSIFGEQNFFPSVVCSTQEAVDADSSTPFDFVVVCTKATTQSVASVKSLLHPAIHPGYTSIVVIQNGIGVEKCYGEAFPENIIISGVTYLPTSQIGPTIFSHTETQVFHLGPFPTNGSTTAHHQKTESFAALIKAGGAQATVHVDIQIERWKKLIGNATWNPICALSRCRDLEFLQASHFASDFVAKAMLEVVAIADALGYGAYVQVSAVDVQIQRSAARPWPGVEPSMMFDMKQGRSMEVEAVIGEVVRLAKDNSVDVPRLETLYVLLKGLNWFIQTKN